jgi:Fe2+ transport system protein FeoA
LDAELDLEDLAAVAHFSPFHFHRVFRGMVGESVKEHIRRLRELGFHEGALVQVIQSGSPCIIRLDNCKLCLRDCEMSQVMVRPRISA